jgi:hypothetical protein
MAGCSEAFHRDCLVQPPPVVALTAVFTGMVLKYRPRFNAWKVVANVVVRCPSRANPGSPVLAGLMVAGRTAPPGALRDRMRADGPDRRAVQSSRPNPMTWWRAAPFIDGTLAMPLLVLVADTGREGAGSSGTQQLADRASIQGDLRSQVLAVVSGLIKAAVFGFVITLMGCWPATPARRCASNHHRRRRLHSILALDYLHRGAVQPMISRASNDMKDTPKIRLTGSAFGPRRR